MMKPAMSRAIDVRQLRLSKWILPKTESISSLQLSNQVRLSASYFDAVEVLEMNNGHFFASDQITGRLFHARQGICLYAPASVERDRRRIRYFWKEQAASREPLYICMVRLTDEDLAPDKLHSHIDWAFHDQAGIPKSKVLYYYSMDFCDLVLFVRGVRFSQYLAAVEVLNFRTQESGIRIVRDTISIYAIRPDVLNDSVPLETLSHSRDQINFTLRLGVLDYSCLKEFYQVVQQKLFPGGTDPDVHCEMSLGRSDFTLYAQGKDYPWIVSLCRILDQFTSRKDSGFLTFDISVGADYEKMVSIIQRAGVPAKTGTRSLMYDRAQEFSLYCAECQQLLKRLSIDSSYLSEIQRAMTDLLKDGFAMDFVLSVYESFWHLINYIIHFCRSEEKQYLPEADRREAIQALLDGYAVSLATIVNCTMHSDREFIQVPSFNLFFQSVPPKLLAFYTAIANQIAKRLTQQDEGHTQFTFLFMPSYKDGINVNSLMPSRETDSRILAVNVQQTLLVTPEKLLPLIGHEIAHYAGRKSREREFRTACYLDSLLAYQLDLAFFSEMTDHETVDLYEVLCNQFAQHLREAIMIQRGQQFQDHHFVELLHTVSKSGYLLSFLDDEVMMHTTDAWVNILEQHWHNGAETFARRWIKKLDGYTCTDYLSELIDGNAAHRRECLRIICQWGFRQISAPYADIIEYEELYNWFEWLRCAYSEAYADIVMLSLLGLTDVEEYRRIIRENLLPGEGVEYFNEYNRLRVSAVTAVLGRGDSGWLEMDVGAPVFQRCALRQLIKYLQKCREQLDTQMGHVAPTPLAQIYQKLRPENCEAIELFEMFRQQSHSYQQELSMLLLPGISFGFTCDVT